MILLTGLLFASTLLGPQTEECPQADAAMLAMSVQDFDQGERGWRMLAPPGCERDAAGAIRLYREGAHHTEYEDDGLL